jgi:hypothetical protein
VGAVLGVLVSCSQQLRAVVQSPHCGHREEAAVSAAGAVGAGAV